MIQGLARSTRILPLLLIPPLLLLSFTSIVNGRTIQQQEPKVLNADWNVVGDEIVVTYDLIGPEQGDYIVAVTFLNEADKSVRLPLKAATGDIGTVRGPAKGKTIKWSYKNDVPTNLSGQGFYFGFEITQMTPETGSSVSPIWGILVIAGVVVAAVLLLSLPPAGNE